MNVLYLYRYQDSGVKYFFVSPARHLCGKKPPLLYRLPNLFCGVYIKGVENVLAQKCWGTGEGRWSH
jgi:hypothetical protein